MAIDRNLSTWIPGVVKLGTADALTDTSLVFTEELIHPSSQDPFATVSTEEEDVLNFSYFYLDALVRHQATLPESDRPRDFSVRRNFFTNSNSEGLSATFTVTVPLTTALIFGRKEIA